MAINITLLEKCPYSELFSSVFSRIRAEYGEMQSIYPYSVWMWENTDQNNSEYGHFLRTLILLNDTAFFKETSYVIVYKAKQNKSLTTIKVNNNQWQMVISTPKTRKLY